MAMMQRHRATELCEYVLLGRTAMVMKQKHRATELCEHVLLGHGAAPESCARAATPQLLRSEASTCCWASQSETSGEAGREALPEQPRPPLLRTAAVEALLRSTRGGLRRAAYRKAGARVLVRLLETSEEHAGAVADELLGAAAILASHRFGHRVILALLRADSAGVDVTVRVLIDEVLRDVAFLVTDKFGRRVVTSLLERGSEGDRRVVQRTLLEDLPFHSLHRQGSHVVAAALEHCTGACQEALCQELLSSHVGMLAEGPTGCRVIEALLRCCWAPPARELLLSQLEVAEEPLFTTRQGRRLLKELGYFDSDLESNSSDCASEC